MDHAVALVQAYLQANGYFTIAEYPVLTRLPDGGYKSATDVDLLALRLCHAGGVIAAGDQTPPFTPDPALEIPQSGTDLLLAEVKEGRAELNKGAKDPDILRAVLSRCGLQENPRIERSIQELVRKGKTRWPGDTWVRMLAFGSTVEPKLSGFLAISLPHVTDYLRTYVRDNWEALRHAQIRQQALGFMALQEQVELARAEPEEPTGRTK